MNRIDKHLFIGNVDDAESAKPDKIDAILNVAEEQDYKAHEGIEYHKVGLTDDANNSCASIQKAVDTLAGLVSKGKTVLLHCAAGRSRAPSVAAMYYHQKHGHTMNSAIQAIKDKRDIVDPNDGIWDSFVACAANMKGGQGDAF